MKNTFRKIPLQPQYFLISPYSKHIEQSKKYRSLITTIRKSRQVTTSKKQNIADNRRWLKSRIRERNEASGASGGEEVEEMSGETGKRWGKG